MKRRTFLKSVSTAMLSTGFSTSCTKSQTPPNIIYILADDLGYGDVSCCNEQSKLETPHIDSIYENGIKFTDAHSGSAVCTPTRYGILTGRYSWRTRLKKGVLWSYDPHLIDPNRLTVASLLKTNGYKTACIGKWHLGVDWGLKDENGKREKENIDYTKPVKNGPNSVGFDYSFIINASLDIPPYVYIENEQVTSPPNRETVDEKSWWRLGPTGADFHHKDVLPKFTEKTVDYIKHHNSGSPFFIYFPLPAPHTPILPTKEFLNKSGTNAYGDFVLQVDWTVGQILQALKDRNIENNTLVIFTSDNGCSPEANFDELAKFDHDPSFKFRGHKADIFEGGHRIPFLAQWPAAIPAKQNSDATICLTDFMATAAAIINKPLPDNAGEDSFNMLPVLKGNTKRIKRQSTIHHSVNGSFAIRKGKWKLNMCPGSGGWSYPKPGNQSKGLPEIQLYNIEQDIQETNNIYHDHPEIVENLKHELKTIILDGRSTLGTVQKNDTSVPWPQIDWTKE